MTSRMDRYNNQNNNLSRSKKNKELYEELYSNTNYSNMVVIDDSNEIDIAKIKEIIDREKKEKKIPKEAKVSNNIYESIPEVKDDYPKKLYDINEVLKEAKNKRDILEEANEKRKREHYSLKSNEELEEELAKTRKVYENLVKEEKELLNIMNTLTNVSSTDMALDMFEDLKPSENTIVTKPIDRTKTEVNIKKIEDNNEDSTEYSTDTFMFNTKDFDGIESMKNEVKRTNLFIKILIFVLTVLIIFVGVYVVKTYLIN